MNKIFLIFLLIFLTSCEYPFSNVNETKWATVDSYKIEKTITLLIENKNPYLPEYPHDHARMNSDYNSTKSQVTQVKTKAIIECQALYKKATTITPSRVIAIDETTGTVKAIRNGGDLYQACLTKITDSQLMIDLTERIEYIDNIRAKQRLHKLNIAKLAKEKTKYLIANYAEEKFDLIIDKNTSPIFNKAGITLSITGAVINKINNTPMDFTLLPAQ